MTTPLDPTPSIDSLDAVIATYVQAVESGQVPDRQELIGRHPDLADELRDFFTDFDRMERVGSPLRLAGEQDVTGAFTGNGQTILPTIRYFGDYELLEEIARGGMGIVYKARQVSLNRVVALKMILAGTFASPREIQRFRAEAEAAATLDHPHIVSIYEIGEYEGQQYFTMKFVDGTSLARRALGPVRAEVAGLVAVARAVHHAHQHGVLHRDLKPSNVLVDHQGTQFVTDFGLAKRLTDTNGSLTDPGQVLGTPRYMSPEQAAGRRDMTVAVDVYSLGVILYERLTGRPPFTSDVIVTLLHQVRESEPPRPSSIRPAIDRDLETVTLKCLEKDPTRRYLGASVLADELDRWLAGEPITARPSGALARAWKWARRNPSVAALATSVISLLVLMAVISTVAAVRLGRSARSLAAAARSSEGLYLAAQSDLVCPTNPGLALVLGLEAAERHPGPMAHEAVLAAMDASYEMRTLIGHSAGVPCLEVSLDGRTVVTGSVDRTARLWDVISGRELASFAHDASVLAVRLTPDGRRLVTLSWKPVDWNGPIDGHSHPFQAIVRVWDLSSSRSLAVWTEEFDAAAFAASPWNLLLWPYDQKGYLELSSDGRFAVVSTAEYSGHPPRIINLESGTVHARLDGHHDAVAAVAYSPDGRRVATASADGTAGLWDTANGKELVRLKGHLGPVSDVVFSPDGRRVLTLSGGHRYGGLPEPKEVHGRLWDVESGACVATLVYPKVPSTNLDDTWVDWGNHHRARFSPDGRAIFTVGRTDPTGASTDPKPPAVWDAIRGQFVRFLRRDGRRGTEATELAVSADGLKLAVAYSDGEVRLLDSNGAPLRTLRGHAGRVNALAFTPDGQRLVTSSQDGTARVWDTRTGAEDDFARGRWANVMQLVFSPDGRRLATMTDDSPSATKSPTTPDARRSPAPIAGHVIQFRDVAEGRVLATTPGLDRKGSIASVPTPIQFSLDGRLLLARDSMTVCLFDTESGRLMRTVGPAKPRIMMFPLATFSPDGRKVVVDDGDLYLYDTATGRECLRIAFASVPRAGEGYFQGVRFSPDGVKLLTTGHPSACLWNSENGQLLGELNPLFYSMREDIKTSGSDVLGEGHEAAFSPDGHRVVTFHGPSLISAGPHFVGIWDAGTARRLVVLRGHGGSVNSADFSPDSRRLLTASQDGTARIWNAGNGHELARLEGHQDAVERAIFSPDAQVILTYGKVLSTRLWDGSSGRPICILARSDLGVQSAGFSPDGRLVAVSFKGRPALTRVWNVDFLAVARARQPRDLTPVERAQFALSAP